MKIALVWNHPSRLLDCSFRFEQYLAGFRALGHDPVVVCDPAAAEGFDGPLEVAGAASRFEEPSFWREVGAGVAVIVTWHRMAAVLAAMRTSGTRTISITDTDGRVSWRTHPLAALERLLVYQNSLADRLRCLKYWSLRVLTERIRGSEEDREALASTRCADAVIFGHERAKQSFARFLARYGEPALDRRVAVVPFTIGASFLGTEVPATRNDRIVAIGRWDDPQKDAGLLAAAITRFLAAGADTEVRILGHGGEPWFRPLERRFQAVRYLGVQPQESVARILGGSRAIVFSSRWEGSPHAALEALAMGATLVGPSIPSLASWSAGGRFGTVSGSRRTGALARALAAELAAWEAGQRSPGQTADHWRRILAPQGVCRSLLEALP